MQKLTLAEIHGFSKNFPKVTPAVGVLSKSVQVSSTLHDKKSFVGIEIEIENAPKCLQKGSLGKKHTTSELLLLKKKQPVGTKNGTVSAIDIELFHKLWGTTQDLSLRGDEAREYIFGAPLQGNSVVFALELLEKICNATQSPILPSGRCSTHVHINTLDLTVREFLMFILLCVIYEPALFDVAGVGRERNIYCIPLGSSMDLLESLSAAFHNEQVDNTDGITVDIYEELTHNWCKYSAVNLGSNKNCKGTVEFRHLPSTVDSSVIVGWINLLLRMRAAAVSYVSCGMSFSEVSGMAMSCPVSMGKSVFKSSYKYLMTNSTESALWDGARTSAFVTNRISLIA